MFLAIYLTRHSEAVRDNKIEARPCFAPRSVSGSIKQSWNKAAESILPTGSWPNTCHVLGLVLHTDETHWTSVSWPGPQWDTGQALRQKHYRSIVKRSSTSLWDSSAEVSCNPLVATERKYYMCPVKAPFYCFWADKLHFFLVVCGHGILWELLLS